MPIHNLRIAVAVVVLVCNGVATLAATRQDVKPAEVTKVDWVALPKILATGLSTFGVTLGMPEAGVVTTIRGACPSCSMKVDPRDGELDITVGADKTPAV